MKRSKAGILVAPIVVLAVTLGGCAAPRVIEVSVPRAKGGFLDKSPLLFRIEDGRSKYQALVGPLKERGEVNAYIHQSVTTVGTTSAWLYLVGQYPVAETELVHAGATGTTMIVAAYPEYTRVFFLCADRRERVFVTSKKTVVSGGRTRFVDKKWHYIDAKKDTGDRVKFSAVRRVPRSGEADPEGARALVELVKQAVDAAGLEGWCEQP